MVKKQANNSVTHRTDGIIHIRESGYQTKESVLQLCADAESLVQHCRQHDLSVKILVELCGRDGRSSEAQEEGPTFLRLDSDLMAVCGAATATRLVINYLTRKYNQHHRLRYFSSLQNAAKWLQES